MTYSQALAGDGMQPMPGSASGGGIYALGSVELIYSNVSKNAASTSTYQGSANYANISAGNKFTSKYSTVSYGTAAMYSPAGVNMLQTRGGGIGVLDGDVKIEGSTISGNSAGQNAGIFIAGAGDTSITNSTIASNEAAYGYGGINVEHGLSISHLIVISNSTITDNVALSQQGAGGVFIEADLPLELESTIIANNVSGGTHAGDLDAGAALTVTGAADLVGTIGANVALPGGTLRTDPNLGPLQDNGGLTRTCALLAGSPAIDAGNNVAGVGTDQRGAGFARIVGAAADIGAFEIDSDVIFASGFN